MKRKKKAKGASPPEHYVFDYRKYNRLRKAKKYTLVDLSIKSGINIYSLSRYGTRRSIPRTPNIAFLLADALGCSVHDLYSKREDMMEVEI